MRCPNPDCPAKLAEAVKHFVSKGAMDIDGVGDKLVERLLALGLIDDAADLYRLEAEQLAGWSGWARSRPPTSSRPSRPPRTRPLARVLFALGILHVGGENAELLVRRFGSMAALREASVEEIGETPGIGPIIAQSVWEYFRDPRNLDLVRRLEAGRGDHDGAGTRRGAGEAAGAAGGAGAEGAGPLSGKTFVLTGTLPRCRARRPPTSSSPPAAGSPAR